jgi:hypothetical protein
MLSGKVAKQLCILYRIQNCFHQWWHMVFFLLDMTIINMNVIYFKKYKLHESPNNRYYICNFVPINLQHLYIIGKRRVVSSHNSKGIIVVWIINICLLKMDDFNNITTIFVKVNFEG